MKAQHLFILVFILMFGCKQNNNIDNEYDIKKSKMKSTQIKSSNNNLIGVWRFVDDENPTFEITYPENPEMDVYYEYGDYTAGNQAGRITRMQDASGTQRFSYGKLGELIKNERTFVMPGGSETYTFEMRWAYDSWNRVLNITYPDSEVVHYHYDRGGQLQSMFGVKQQDTVPIIDFIGYDAMGSRSRIEYGNGTFTDYTYDAYRQRLSQLQTTSGTKQFMDLHYSYDKENNIKGIANIAAAVNGLGGVYENTYTYDDMYRLTAASGTFTDKNSTDFPFTLEMSYTASGNIATKNMDAYILSADNSVSQTVYDANYHYNSGRPHAIDSIKGNKINQNFTWDLNGNLSTHTDNIKNLNRYLCWDEENRLMAVKDQNYLSAYIYDAGGERVWKLSGEVTKMTVSGKYTVDAADLSNKTLYVSPFVVYNQQGYSKHYYAGAERVSSRIGGGTLYGLQHPINDTVTPITTEYGYPELSTQLWSMLERSFTDCLDLQTEYITMENRLTSVEQSAETANPEDNWYIYHSDHSVLLRS
jgi:YD repeat-containing protein